MPQWQDRFPQPEKTTVQSLIEQDQGRVQQLLAEQAEVEANQKEQVEVQKSYAEMVRMYPGQFTKAKKLVEEGVHDRATIARILRQEEEKSTKVPQARTTWEKFKGQTSKANQSLIFDFMFNEVLLGLRDKEETIKAYQEWEQRSALDPIEAEGWFEEILLATSDVLPSIWEATKQGAMGATAGATGAMVLGQMGPQIATPEELFTVPMGIAGGSSAAVFARFQQQGAGAIYKESILKGVDDQTAGLVAQLGAIPYALIEQWQIGKLVPMGFKSQFGDLITTSFLQSLKKVAGKGAVNYTEQVVQEVAQEANNITFEQLAIYFDNQVKNGEIEQVEADEIYERLKTTLVQSAKGLIIPAGVSTGVSAGQVVSEVSKQQAVESKQEEEIALEVMKPKYAQLTTKKRKTQEKAIDEVDAALEAGQTSPGTATLAKFLLQQDPDFESKSSLAISNEVVELTDNYIKTVLKQDPEEFFTNEGITREEAEEYYATGSTQVNFQKGTTRTAINLYKGHDADTLVEEWYHDFFEHLDDKSKAAFDKYHKESEDTRSLEEHFGQEGRDFFFSEKLHENAGPIREIFEQARQTLKDLIERIRKIRGAKIPKKIQELYKDAAARKLPGDVTVKPKKGIQFQARKKPAQKLIKPYKSFDKDKDSVQKIYSELSKSYEIAQNFFDPSVDIIGSTGMLDLEILQPQFKGSYGVESSDNTIILNAIYSLEKGKGQGNKLLTDLLKAADKTNTTIVGSIEQIGVEGLNNQQLRKWYASKGFDVIQEGDGYKLKYSPKGTSKKITLSGKFNETESDLALTDFKKIFTDGMQTDYLHDKSQVDINHRSDVGEWVVYDRETGADETVFSEEDALAVANEMIDEKATKGPKIRFQARKKGVFVGSPKGIDTSGKLRTMRDRVDELVKEGEVGKDWYDNSAQAALDLAGGEMQMAERILDLIALTSPSMPVKTNMGQAIKLIYQLAQGDLKGAGRFPSTVKRQVEGLLEGKKLSELMKDAKVVSFSENLKKSLRKEDDNRVTVDVWMQRAYGYENEVPTDLQYKFVKRDVQRIAKNKGWTPKQVQAAIWVGAKARWETIGGNKLPFKTAIRKMKSTPASLKRLAIAKTDYADAMKTYEGRISYEYIPSTESKTLPGIHKASYEEKMEYHMEMNKALLNERGKNIIAKELGIPEVRSLDGPGFWEGAVSPSRQMELLVSSKSSEKEINKKIGKEYFDTVEAFNSIIGLLYKQDEVATTKEFVSPSQKQANATSLIIEEGLSVEEIAAINKELGNGLDIVPTSYGGIVINFINYDGQPNKKKPNYNKNYGKPFSKLDNNAFNEIVKSATEKALQKSNKTVNLERSLSAGRLTKGEKNGQNYRQRISESRQRSAAIRVYDQVYQQVQQVNERFSEKYNWGNPGKLESFSSPKITFQARKRAKPKPTLELDPERYRDIVQRKIQDKMNRLGHVMEKAGEQKNISDEQNAYTASELYIGKAKQRMDVFEADIFGEKGSLLDRIVKSGYTIDDFGEYLHARHAKERNAHIASIRDDMPDGGSGMTNAEANKILKKYTGDKKIKSFAREFYNKVTKKALDDRLEAGLITAETHETLSAYYKNYVPLFVVKDVENRSASGKGFSVPQGKEIKRARGSTEARSNPVISGIFEMMNMIRRAEKNQVGLKFLKVAQEFDSSAWDVEMQTYTPVYDKYGEIQYMDPKFKLADNVFAVRKEGKLYFITIKDDALVKGLKNLGAERGYKYLTAANTYLRSIVTTFNPEFVITNFARDLQTALIHVSGEHKGISATVLKNTPKAIRGVWGNVRGKDSTYWSEMYDELKEAGGKVGWFEMDTLQDYQDKVEKRLLQVQKGIGFPRLAAKAVGDLVNHTNEAVESGVRLATYEALRKKGVSKAKAAQVAKNITVNFNKKGEWGTLINSLYMFSNATIQGGYRIGVSVAKNRKTQAIVGSIVGMSAALSLVNYMVAPDEWEKMSKWEKDNYLIIMRPGGTYFKIRVPYGYNVFHVAGQTAGDLIQEGHVKKNGFENLDYWEASGRVAKSMSDAFSPFGDGSVAQALSPTVTDPLIQIAENKKFSSSPIRPERAFFQKKGPDYKNYWEQNPPSWISRWVTESLAEITGGKTHKGIKTDKDGNPKDHYTSGWADINPTTLDHIGGFLTGGLGKFASRSVDIGINFATGKPTASRETPFVRQFYGQADKRGITEKQLIRKYIDNSEINIYNHVEVARFKRYVYDAIKLDALTDTQAKEVLDENGNMVPRVIRDFLNSQRLAMGEKKIDYRKIKKKKKRKVTF